MLVWRLILGLVFGVTLAGLCWLDFLAESPGRWLLPLAVGAALLAALEVVDLLVSDPSTADRLAAAAGTVLVVAASGVALFWPDYPALGPVGQLGWSLVGIVLALGVGFGIEMVRFRGRTDACQRLATLVFGMVVVGVPLGLIVQLRALNDGPWGMLALLSLVIPVKLGDIGAFTVGRLLGRHKMAPYLSPGKTWEGVVGGLGASCLGAYGVFWLLGPVLGVEVSPNGAASTGRWLVFGLAVGVGGILGDLAESLLKRSAGRKDSSRWLPGFGGVLDLLDSLLGAVPIAYALWLIGLVGP